MGDQHARSPALGIRPFSSSKRHRPELIVADVSSDSLRKVFAFGKCARTPFELQARFVFVLWNDVEVDVHHLLMRLFTVVLQDVVRGGPGRFHECSSDSGKGSSDGSGRVITQLMKKGSGFLGYDEKVSLTQGPHIEKCQNMVVLVESVAGYLTSEDAREDRVWFIGLHPSNLTPPRSKRFFLLRFQV